MFEKERHTIVNTLGVFNLFNEMLEKAPEYNDMFIIATHKDTNKIWVYDGLIEEFVHVTIYKAEGRLCFEYKSYFEECTYFIDDFKKRK